MKVSVELTALEVSEKCPELAMTITRPQLTAHRDGDVLSDPSS